MKNMNEKGDTVMMLEPERLKITETEHNEISIPKNYYKELNFKDEALIEICNSTLVIKPTDNIENIDFSEDILKDLVAKGYSGEELIEKFKEIKKSIPSAIEKMTEEALSNNTLTFDMDFDKFFEGVEDE